jgi:hypothetical protein
VHDKPPRLGIVVEVEKGFYPHSAFNNSEDRVRVFWNTGEDSREPAQALKILKKS